MTEFECILDEPISSAWPVASDCSRPSCTTAETAGTTGSHR